MNTGLPLIFFCNVKKVFFFTPCKIGPDKATKKIHISCYMAGISKIKGLLESSHSVVYRLVCKVIRGGGGSYACFLEKVVISEKTGFTPSEQFALIGRL